MPNFSAYLASPVDGSCRVKLAGDFDYSGRALADEVLESADGEESIVLDLSDVDFIDSMGIHFVVMAHDRAEREGRKLTIVRGGPNVTRVFSLVGLDDALPFADAA